MITPVYSVLYSIELAAGGLVTMLYPTFARTVQLRLPLRDFAREVDAEAD